MATSTTRLGLQQPVGADPSSAFRTSITTNATILDNAVTFLSGTLAARPAAGLNGRHYYATDAKLYYQDTGTAWLTLLLAGAWTGITLSSGLTATGAAYAPSARAEGDLVRLKGGFSNLTGSTQTAITTLAAAFRPTKQVTALAGSTGANAGIVVSIYASGAVTAFVQSPWDVWLDGITYSLS